VENWNLNIQQQLWSTAVLHVAYVGNHGVNLYSVLDINQVNQNSPLENPDNCDHCESAGRPLNANCPVVQGGLGLGGPCFPYIGYLDQLGNQENSIYHALQVTFTKRYSHGLYFLAGSTYAHAIDIATSNTPSNTPQNNLNYAAERGDADFDIRGDHNLYPRSGFGFQPGARYGWFNAYPVRSENNLVANSGQSSKSSHIIR
jgi:hypothetical protein